MSPDRRSRGKGSGRSPRERGGRRRLLALLPLVLLAGLPACRDKIAKADAYEALSDQLMIGKAYPAAVSTLDKATRLDSNEPRRWLKLGRAWRALDNPALSAMAYQHALDLDPSNQEALEHLAILLVRAGRYDEAKTYVDPLLVLSPNDIGGLLGSGAIAFFEHRYGDADRIAGQIIQLAPDTSEGYALRARVYEARGNPRQAAALLEQRLTADPDNLDIATELLGIFRRIGDAGGIRRAALALARLQPDNVSYQLEAARAHHAAGREPAARQILARLFARYKSSPNLVDAIAQYWVSTLPPGQAIAVIAKMADQVHGRPRATLAGWLIALGQAPAAVRLLAVDAATPVGPFTSEAHAAYAHALLAAGREKEAATEAQTVLNYDQNDVATLVQATIALRRRDYDKALALAQSVRENDPDNAEAALLIPKAYEGKGDVVLARRSFGDALSAMPNNLEVVKGYAQWLADHGSADDAVNVAAQFRRTHPRSGPANQFARDLCLRLKTATCLSAEDRRNAWDL